MSKKGGTRIKSIRRAARLKSGVPVKDPVTGKVRVLRKSPKTGRRKKTLGELLPKRKRKVVVKKLVPKVPREVRSTRDRSKLEDRFAQERELERQGIGSVRRKRK